MYKPYVTCDNPKGVVECGTMMRYRSNSHKMKDKSMSRKSVENLETIKQDKEEKVVSSKGSTDRDFDPSSLQLVKVSRGAMKLNNMIESWSRGFRYDGKSEDIAKDLLKGAIELQESLEMLRKVQDASNSMARSKRKQDEKRVGSSVDAKVNDGIRKTIYSNQVFVDGSSSSCREELKNVIKESLVRQNLFQSTSTSERLDSASASAAFPCTSTSSSQSSVVWYDKVSDSSSSPNTSRTEKSTNLVAKLMGLEQVSSRTYPSVMQKQFVNHKIVNQKRPVFEIDTPKIRASERQKTLREILETTHFNELLKKDSPIRKNMFHIHDHVHHSNDLRYEEFKDLPPIVLMKPRYPSYQEHVKTYEPTPQEEFSSFRNLKAKGVPSKTFKPREGSSTILSKEIFEEKLPKRIIKEEKLKRVKEVVEFDVKEIKRVENKKVQKASQRLQASETVDEKAKVVKKITILRKPIEKEVSKAKLMPKTQEQVEKMRKLRSVSRIEKNEIPNRKITASNSDVIVTKPMIQKVNNSKELRKSHMKKQISVDEVEAAKEVDEQLRQEEGKNMNDSSEKEIKIITTITDNLIMEHEEIDTFANMDSDNCEGVQKYLGEGVLMLNCEQENDAIPYEEVQETASIISTDFKKDSSELKYLLLKSKSFIEHADELLNLEVDNPMIITKIEMNGISNAKLYLDCANEITERKNLQESSQLVHPLWLTCVGNSRLKISLSTLVEEVYNAIENLTCYSENCETKLLLDNVCAMLERDMKCNNRLINGIWNFGWKHGFSCDEVEQVVDEVENMVLGGLIEEIIVNL